MFGCLIYKRTNVFFVIFIVDEFQILKTERRLVVDLESVYGKSAYSLHESVFAQVQHK